MPVPETVSKPVSSQNPLTFWPGYGESGLPNISQQLLLRHFHRLPEAVNQVEYFTLQQPVAGWTTLALLICFLGGLGFAQLGVMGLYLGRILEEVRQRPLYIVDQALNLNEKNSFDGSSLH